MPNLTLLGAAVLLSAVASGVVFLFIVWPWRTPRPWRSSAAWVLGLGAGFYAGCGLLGQLPRWPPVEDRDRFLAILLPLALAVELAAAFLPVKWMVWALRLFVATAAAPILLYNTTYLADLSGPGSAEWPPALAALILLALAALLFGVWVACDCLQARTSERDLSTVLALTCLVAAFTVMLSGYYRGGLLGLPLAGAFFGAMLSSSILHRRRTATEGNLASASADATAKPNGGGPVGITLVALFYVLLVGRFFGSLPTSSALALLLAPLAAWLVEVPGLTKFSPRARSALRLLVVAVPLCVVLLLAQLQFAEAWKAKSRPVSSNGVGGSFSVPARSY